MTVHTSCHCTKTAISIRCARSHPATAPSLSCGQNCGRPLLCGNHFCERECHPGECAPCTKTELVQCFCGKNTTQVDCGEGMSLRQEVFLVSIDGHRTTWVGRYDCGNKCGRYGVALLRLFSLPHRTDCQDLRLWPPHLLKSKSLAYSVFCLSKMFHRVVTSLL